MSRILIIGDQLLTMGGEPLSREIGAKLTAQDLPVEHAAGHADAVLRMQLRSFGVVITSCDSELAEDLALLTELRAIRPGLKCIVLARQSTPDEVIAALRARVYAVCTPPFDRNEIAYLAANAASDNEWRDDIQVRSAKPGWVSVRVNCRLINAERLMTFAKELSVQLPQEAREDMMQALREILLNAMEHGAAFNPDQIVEVTGVRTARSYVFYIQDPGAGFRRESVVHAASGNSGDDPLAQITEREREGMRAGGYGLLVASGTVDELIYSEIGNEVLLIKYLDSYASADKA